MHIGFRNRKHKARSFNACQKCGADYGFASCRIEDCPFRHSNSQTVHLRTLRSLGNSHVIVLGNEKGGSGKSTTAMHLIVALLNRGFKVGSIDLDTRQGSLSRYIGKRCAFADQSSMKILLPEHRRVQRSNAVVRSAAEREEREALDAALGELSGQEFIIVDTPGSDSYLSRLGHFCADTLITPLNDSFLDLDVLADIDAVGPKILGPSFYSEMVWEQRQQRANVDLAPFDWVVMRNRLTHIDARNKRDIGALLQLLSSRFHFRLASGFGERVIFRELFLEGLTLLDLRNGNSNTQLTLSHVAARQEVRELLQAIALPENKGVWQLRFLKGKDTGQSDCNLSA